MFFLKTLRRLKEIKEEQLKLEKIRTGFLESIYEEIKNGKTKR